MPKKGIRLVTSYDECKEKDDSVCKREKEKEKKTKPIENLKKYKNNKTSEQRKLRKLHLIKNKLRQIKQNETITDKNKKFLNKNNNKDIDEEIKHLEIIVAKQIKPHIDKIESLKKDRAHIKRVNKQKQDRKNSDTRKKMESFASRIDQSVISFYRDLSLGRKKIGQKEKHKLKLITNLSKEITNKKEKDKIAEMVNDKFCGQFCGQKKCTIYHALNSNLQTELSKYSSNPVISKNSNKVFDKYRKEEKKWNTYCKSVKISTFVYENSVREVTELGNIINESRRSDSLYPNLNGWSDEKNNLAKEFWFKAFGVGGTLSDSINNNQKFSNILTQDIPEEEIETWYSSALFDRFGNISHEKIYIQSTWQVFVDMIEKIFCDVSFIGKGQFKVIPSLDDLKGGVCYMEAISKNKDLIKYPNNIKWDSSWDKISGLREINWDKKWNYLKNKEKIKIDDPNYWNIIKDKPDEKLNRDNVYAFMLNRKNVFRNRPEIYLDYLIRDYINSVDVKDEWQKKIGICAFNSMRSPTKPTGFFYVSNLKYHTGPVSEISPEITSFEINHSNLIFFTPVKKDDKKIHLQCSYYDPNESIVTHVKALIRLMVDNLRKKYAFDNEMNEKCVIEDDIHWISPNDINPDLHNVITSSWHGMFGYTQHGICQHVSYLLALLWGKYGRYFDNPKHMWTHLTVMFNWEKDDDRTKFITRQFKNLVVGIMKISSRIYKDKEVISYIKAHIDKIKKQDKDIDEDWDRTLIQIQKILQEKTQQVENKSNENNNKKNTGCVGNMCAILGGKKVKKVRKHQGIIQTGGNAGRLQKGYRYSGKKLKNGLPQIIKCKSKKC
jgi:hypothetical protein